MKGWDWLLAAVLAAVIVLVVSAVWFASAHGLVCADGGPVTKMRDGYLPVVSGKTVVMVPQYDYLCEDGTEAYFERNLP